MLTVMFCVFVVFLYFPLFCSLPPPLVSWFQRVAGGVAVFLLMMHVYCQKYACVPFCGFMHTIVLSLKHLCVNTVTYCMQIYAYCKWESLKFSCFYMNLKATTLNLPEYNSYFYVHTFRFVGVCGKVLKRCRRDTYYQYCSGEIVKHMASVQRTLFQVTLYIVQFSFNHTAGRCY